MPHHETNDVIARIACVVQNLQDEYNIFDSNNYRLDYNCSCVHVSIPSSCASCHNHTPSVSIACHYIDKEESKIIIMPPQQ